MVAADNSLCRAPDCHLWEGTRQGQQLGPSPAQQYHLQNSLGCLPLLSRVSSPLGTPTAHRVLSPPHRGGAHGWRPLGRCSVHGRTSSWMAWAPFGASAKTGSGHWLCASFRKALIMSSTFRNCAREFLCCLQQNVCRPCVLGGCRMCKGVEISFGVICCQPGTVKRTELHRYFGVISLAEKKGFCFKNKQQAVQILQIGND